MSHTSVVSASWRGEGDMEAPSVGMRAHAMFEFPGMASRCLGVLIAGSLVIPITGCTKYQLTGPSTDRTLLIDEQGKERRLFMVTILWGTWMEMSTLLVESLPENDQTSLRRMVRQTPRRRNAGTLWSLAEWLTNQLPEDRARWIISNQPIVIGLGTSPPRPRLTQPYRPPAFILNEDLDETVDMLVVRDKWIEYEPGGGYTEHTAPLPSGLRFIKLDPPKTLREIMAARPWVR